MLYEQRCRIRRFCSLDILVLLAEEYITKAIRYTMQKKEETMAVILVLVW